MGTVSYLLDTNVLIHFLNKTEQSAVDLVTALHMPERAISPVTWMEVLVGASLEDETETRNLLRGFKIIQLNAAIMERTVSVRKRTRLKLPDAMIYASALATGRTLVTYNTRDFPPGTPSVLHPESR